jgi:dipeptidyl aminopeptidase/acylaminoacyl peptidase
MCVFSRSRFRWLRRLCCLVCVLAGCCSVALHAQETPLQTIEEDITAFAFAPDGRIVYSVRHLMNARLRDSPRHFVTYDLQRDDIWIQEAGGKRRRLIQGEKLIHGAAPFSYSVDSFRFSPDGRMILAELDAIFVVDKDGTMRDAKMALLFDETGRQVRIGEQKELLFDSTGGGWLADNATVVYLTEAVKPHLLYGITSLRFASGRGISLFAGRTFVDAAWLPNSSAAVAIERDRNLTGPPRLQRLDLVKEIDAELATLDGYSGGLSVSPSGTRAAYFLDHEVLEIRDLASPSHVARVRVGYGPYQWAPDEKRILLKRAVAKKTGDLVWIDLPPLSDEAAGRKTTIPVAEPTLTPLFHGLGFRDFGISPDGRFLAVIQPGKRNLLFYPLTVH